MAPKLTAEAAMNAAQTAMLCPWVWGHRDCFGAAASAFAACWEIDPFPQRGTYSTELGAARKITAAGGFPALVRTTLAAEGLAPCDEVTGSLGLVARGGIEAVGFCVQPGLWAVKTQSGMTFLDDYLEAWRCQI